LLALLEQGPMYGYQLRAEFESRTGATWPLNVGQVYTTLQRLERDGLVESDGGDGEGASKAYRMTAAGQEELVAWLHTPGDGNVPPRDELVIKVLVALRVPGVDVRDLLQVHRRQLIETMQRYTALKADAPEDDLGLALVADAELFRLDATVRWLDAGGASGCADPGAGAAQIPGGAVTAGGSPVLELRQVTKVYGEGAAEVHALRAIDLKVGDGELVAIMGPSGSGKSTLLTIAGTLEEATAGEVLIDGTSVSGMSRNDRARLRRRSIGYVFQDFNLLAGLSAAENVALPLELDGVNAKTARRAALSALGQVDVEELAPRFPDELSGGERQRVAIARSIVGDRHVLLADEPTGALDSVNGEAVMRLLREACKRGVAGVIVTHDAQLASWADRVVFLRDGRVVDQTAPPPDAESLLAPGSTR
jgi:putative ABC transport system ATP-binding protein